MSVLNGDDRLTSLFSDDHLDGDIQEPKFPLKMDKQEDIDVTSDDVITDVVKVTKMSNKDLLKEEFSNENISDNTKEIKNAEVVDVDKTENCEIISKDNVTRNEGKEDSADTKENLNPDKTKKEKECSNKALTKDKAGKPRDPYSIEPESKVPSNPPVIRLPGCPTPTPQISYSPVPRQKVELVTSTDRCIQIVGRLEREQIIAVATEGINVGKEGPLTLLQIATFGGAVYIFDILVNRELFGKGRLRTILENEKIMKVMYSCSSVSAALSYQFAITLANVFDTQIAHLVMEEHKGRRLPTGLKLSEICLYYAENTEKYYTYDWRTDSKEMWTKYLGNYWGQRPLTPDMVDFAAGDVMVLIPDVYRTQREYLEEKKLMSLFRERVDEEIHFELNDVVKEQRGKRITTTLDSILHHIDQTSKSNARIFNILDPDEINAFALVTYEDAEQISPKIARLKTEYILQEIVELERDLRQGSDSWDFRRNLVPQLRYYEKHPQAIVKTKAGEVLKLLLDALVENIEQKYNENATPQMISDAEMEALRALPYTRVTEEKFGPIVVTMYWKLVQDDIHHMINAFRLDPKHFSLSRDDFERLDFFTSDISFVPEPVSSLAAALMDAIHTYNATRGHFRRSGVSSCKT